MQCLLLGITLAQLSRTAEEKSKIWTLIHVLAVWDESAVIFVLDRGQLTTSELTLLAAYIFRIQTSKHQSRLGSSAQFT